MNFKEEIFRSIQTMVDRSVANYKADITYKSVIKNITPKGYIILDRAGSERTVQCSIPNLQLRKFQGVWVKEPMGRLNDIHICGVAEGAGNPARNRRG